ncbi:hypothetical protein V6N11_004812 [Hibiscus sabdariffa]|uniref:F-box domain-containing protein n=1 Tax=Hibiscus sabdariffa TaxID=183260 RepID=A0ABR2SI29_9ROSI
MMRIFKVMFKRNMDKLSALPDELLWVIISLLPLKEAVRTSILSTRWKNLFTSISCLNFDDDGFRRGFMNSVDRVLFARKGVDATKFRLKCRNPLDGSRAEGWIQYALWHNVRELELDLSVPMEISFKMPSGLFTCRTLVTLKLVVADNFDFKIPRKVRLPCLKILHLESIEFSDDDSVERLFSSCQVLDELTVHRCSFENLTEINVFNPSLKRLTISHHPGVYEFENRIVINAPNLVYFKYFHFIAKDHFFMDLDSLVEAYIDFGPVFNSVFYEFGTTDLIRGISRLQSLHFSGPFSEALLLGDDQIPALPNMTYLKIGRCYPHGWERLLNFAPFLETLVFEKLPCFQENIMKPPKQVPSCLESQIKVIKFQSFKGKKSELQMVGYFLKHAQALEDLIIHITARQNRKLTITEELLKFPRISHVCQVLIV